MYTRDGTLACPFHGFRFNGHGACTLIPSRRDRDAQVVAPGFVQPAIIKNAEAAARAKWQQLRNRQAPGRTPG